MFIYNINHFYDHIEVYRYIRRNEQRISSVPRTLKEAREATNLVNRLMADVPIKEGEFPSILDLFKVLHKFQIEVHHSTRSLLNNLNSAWEAYIKKLGDADEILFSSKEEFKKNLQQQAERFRNVMKHFHADFIMKLPTSSQT